MPDSVLSDHLIEVLGAERFDSSLPAGPEWSPNMYRVLAITPDQVISVDYFGGVSKRSGDTELDPYDVEEVFSMRKLGCLEELYVSPRLGGIAIATQVLNSFNLGKDRLHLVGQAEVTEEGIVVGAVEELPGSGGWETRMPLQPEAYEFDKEGSRLWSKLDSLCSKAAMETEKISDGDDEEAKKDVYDYYGDSVNGTLEKIIREYTKIFSSGFQVVQPSGILMENDRGRGVLGRLSGDNLVLDPVERNLQFLYSELKSSMGLVEVKSRSIKDIASIISSGKDENGESYSGNLIFPYKMMEYAYGRENIKSGNSEESLTKYQPHSSRSNWGAYAREEVFESLKRVILYAIWKSIEGAGVADEYDGAKANALAQEIMGAFEKAFCTCILVSTYDKSKGNLVALKVRVLDATGSLGTDNLLKRVLEKSHGVIEGKKVMEYPVIVDGYYREYYLELDTKLANAEPLFAYKALYKVKEMGGQVGFDNAIIGKKVNDTILQNGGEIDYKSKLCHAIIAGSRAGKGVWTFSSLSAAVISSKPIFYLDNKPDMASLFLNYGPLGFAVNGANITHDPEGGTDFFSQFVNSDSWVKSDLVPDYMSDALGGSSYKDLGGLIYARALTLVMGIIATRADVPSSIPLLGGEKGIVVVVDEIANANTNFMSSMTYLSKYIASTDYYKQLKSIGDESKVKAEKPLPVGYWAAAYYDTLRKSLERLQTLNKAGLKNREAGVSDVFVLTQEPPNLIESSGEVAEIFKPRNKTTSGVRGTEHPSILPSLALVGGVDAFIGYDKDKRAFLAQGNPASPAYPYLNEVNRNFGYIPSYDMEIKDRFNDISLAKKALYYKPFLLFADGTQEAYFVRNALATIKDAGVEDTQAIIDRNEDPNNPGRIHPAVGFKGYLLEAGMSESQITSNMNKSGEIAQTVVEKMGYKGSWRDFLCDFRPEAIFSIDDVINAFKGVTLEESLDKRLAEFIAVYPECFGRVDGSSGGVDFSDFDEDGSENLPSDDEEDFDGFNGFAPQGDEEEYEPVVSANGKLNVYDGEFGGEEVDYFGNSDTKEDPSSEFYSTPVGGYNVPDPDSVDTMDFDDDLRPNWSETDDAQAALAYLRKLEAQGKLRSDLGAVGRGVYTAPDGSDDSYGYPKEPIRVPMVGSFDRSNKMSLPQLMEEITKGGLRMVGGKSSLRSVSVLDGMLVLNQTAYRPKFPKHYLNGMPQDAVLAIRSGNIASLFNWYELLGTGDGIKRLAFDDVNFVMDYVAPSLRYGNRVDVSKFFGSFRGMTTLTIGGTVYQRNNYRKMIADDDPFNYPSTMFKFANTLDRWGAANASKTWNSTKSNFTRRDIGLGRRILLGTVGGTMAATAGTVAVSAKASKGIGHGLKSGLNGIRSMIRESKDL